MALLLFICTLIISTVHSLFPHQINEIKQSIPYINPKQFLLTKINPTSTTLSPIPKSTIPNLQGADTGLLTVSPSIITSDTEWITVSWHNVSYTGKYDWIGLFNASAASTVYAAPPLKFQYICPSYQACYYPPASGSLKFKILNRRTQYIFAYITESNPYREIKGVTPIISYQQNDLYKPMHVHIATPTSPINAPCGTTNSCMQIMWIQKQINNPMIKYGYSPNNLKYNLIAAETSKLSANNLCGQEYGLPAGTAG
eukprot:814592_1